MTRDAAQKATLRISHVGIRPEECLDQVGSLRAKRDRDKLQKQAAGIGKPTPKSNISSGAR